MAAGDARLRDPLEHEVLGETALVNPGHVSCPKQQCATRAVVLELEDPGALLEALGSDAVDVRLVAW